VLKNDVETTAIEDVLSVLLTSLSFNYVYKNQ